MRFLRAPKFFMVSSSVAVPATFSTTYRHSENFRSTMPDKQMSRKRVPLLIRARSITLRCSAYFYIFEQCLIKQTQKDDNGLLSLILLVANVVESGLKFKYSMFRCCN